MHEAIRSFLLLQEKVIVYFEREEVLFKVWPSYIGGAYRKTQDCSIRPIVLHPRKLCIQ